MLPTALLDHTHTICAISTPPGRGGIAVVRVSGNRAVEMVSKIWSGHDLAIAPTHTAHFGQIVDGDQVLDQAVATLFRAPRSYTGEDVVELSVHGSLYVQQRLLQLLVDAGCRLAHPGEFTRRAFIAGKIDLAQAEAVADIIASTSGAAQKLAMNQMSGALSKRIDTLRDKLIELASLLELELDFSEEDVEFASRTALLNLAKEIETILQNLKNSYHTGRAIIDGITVMLAGVPNAGKSTLLNRLVDTDRAIVSPLAGTTRDIIDDTTEIDGILFRIADTAGLRADTIDAIEQQGIERAMDRARQASIILYLFDITAPLQEQTRTFSRLAEAIETHNANNQTTHVLPVINKTDLQQPATLSRLSDRLSHLFALHTSGALQIAPAVLHSHNDQNTLKNLRHTLGDIARDLLGQSNSEGVVLTNARHQTAVAEAIEHLRQTISALNSQLPPDLTAQHLRAAIQSLGTITGAITSPQILNTIFTRFCIGK